MKRLSYMSRLASIPLLVPLALAACDDTLTSSDTPTSAAVDPLGHIVAAIAVVQPGVNCIRVSTHDLSTDALVRRKFPVTPGQAASFDLGLMTNGTSYRVWGEAYSQLCASVSNSTTPGWLSNIVAIQVTLNQANQVQLDFAKNNPVSVSADFRRGIDRIALDTTGTLLLDEDGTLFTAGGGQLFRNEDPTVFGESWVAGPVIESSYYTSFIDYLLDPDGDLVIAPRDLVAVAGAEGARCAVTTAGEIVCWGQLPWLFAFREDAQGLDGEPNLALPYPSPYPAVSTAIDITVGRDHACALLDDGRGICWGLNTAGQIAPFSPSWYLAYTDIGDGLAQIAAGHSFTCVRELSGGVSCWGALAGIGLSERRPVTTRWNPYAENHEGAPVALGPVKTLAVGISHACALVGAIIPRVACWGSNQKNQLARPLDEVTASPEALTVELAGTIPLDLAVSGDTTCALVQAIDNGVRQVQCWGGAAGTLSTAALGRGIVWPFETLPGVVSGADMSDVRRLFGGPLATGFCAQRDTGGLVCWGQNHWGQLATGSREAAWTPTPVKGL